jgi:hypothetical protein
VTRRAARAGLALACLAPAPAAAHSPLPGIEGFYTGLLHPLSSADQILVLLACAALLGGYRLRQVGPALVALIAGLVVGAVAGSTDADPTRWLYFYAVLAAGLAALVPGRWPAMALLGAGLAGLLLGWASLPEPGLWRDRVITIAGSLTGAFALVLYLAGHARHLAVDDPGALATGRVPGRRRLGSRRLPRCCWRCSGRPRQARPPGL